GYLDFYAAKCIENKITQGGTSVKDILLNLYDNDQGQYNLNISKFQNVLQLLGGILAMKDSRLVEEHGGDLIDALKDTGVRNNSQWYSVYCDLNVNSDAAKYFAQLIAPLLDLNNLIIEDGHVEILSTLLQYVNISRSIVTLNIKGNDKLDHLPRLIDVLKSQNCIICATDGLTIKEANVDVLSTALEDINIDKVIMDINSIAIPTHLPTLNNVLKNTKCNITISISKIADEQVDLWVNSSLPFDKTEIKLLEISKYHNHLPFLFMHIKAIEDCKLTRAWRDLKAQSLDMARCYVKYLWTAVDCIATLPTSLRKLHLGVTREQSTGEVIDPGIVQLPRHCLQLDQLDVHIAAPDDAAAGISDDRLPQLPGLIGGGGSRSLWLSQVSEAHHVTWAINTAKRMEPRCGGYNKLVIPRCGLLCVQLKTMVAAMAGITVTYKVIISSPAPHTPQEEEDLREEVTNVFGHHCLLDW
ncbi:unnamed protein product, partial [Meganyctiphanes norvegica]